MQNDIEIYLYKTSATAIADWLHGDLGDALSPWPAGSSRSPIRSQVTYQGRTIPVMLIRQGDWTSVWFNSAHTPWPDDLTCARAAVDALGTTARCTDGGWQDGDDPDQFLEVTTNGTRTVIWTDGQ